MLFCFRKRPVYLCWEFALMSLTESPYINTIEFIIFLSTQSKPASQEKAFHRQNLKHQHEIITWDPRAQKSLNYSICSSQFMLFWGLIFLAPLHKITSLRIRIWTVSEILVLGFPNIPFPQFKCITIEKTKRNAPMQQYFFNIYLPDDFTKNKKKRNRR